VFELKSLTMTTHHARAKFWVLSQLATSFGSKMVLFEGANLEMWVRSPPKTLQPNDAITRLFCFQKDQPTTTDETWDAVLQLYFPSLVSFCFLAAWTGT